MKKLIIMISWFVVGMSLSSCATVFNSGSQTILAKSSNDKPIEVVINTSNGTYSTKLPTTIVSEPNSFTKVSIEVKDACYEPITIMAGRSITPSYWVNILNYGVGYLVDYLTGTMWKYHNTILVPVTDKPDRPASCKDRISLLQKQFSFYHGILKVPISEKVG